MTDPASVPESAPTAPTPPTLDQDIKQRLEYVIAGRDVTIKVHGRKITLRKWGLRKSLQMSAKVVKLITTVRSILPKEKLSEEDSVAILTQVISHIADDVISIVAASCHEPFNSTAEAEDWLDENMTRMDDLFDMAYIVYDQNLKGEALGKLTDGVESLARKMNSLSTSSYKS